MALGMTRSASSPSLAGTQTSSGLLLSSFSGTATLRMPPPAASSGCCEVRRRDAIPGYRGYIPGKTSETVFGGTFTQANAAAHEMRPASETSGMRERQGLDWTAPQEKVSRRRSPAECGLWTKMQHETHWMNGGQQPVDHGPAVSGYTGHGLLRLKSGTAATSEYLEPGRRFELEHTLTRVRDCQPFDAHRPLMPGYSGHIRNRTIQ